jgi:O-acetyl-ADP-ribose deacetylase (regulator of RNase III)
MPVKFVDGDLFQANDLQALAHGCNCAGAMGKGIAVEFRQLFPEMYGEYKRRCTSGSFQLGDVFCWTENGLTIFNLGTQKSWKTKAELESIKTAVKSMVSIAEKLEIACIGLPRIGAGLGGLSWETVRAVLVEIGGTTKVELRVFEFKSDATRSNNRSSMDC